jgi:2-oxoglutarate dehydrogenase complex dehydrogenase (E1) component-like enzyme
VRTRTFKYKCIVRGRKASKCEKEGIFLESLEAKHPFLKEHQVGKVLCSICKSQFSTQHGGRSDILQHIKKRKHAIAAETKSSTKKLTSYFTKETITDECKHIAAEGGLFAFHTIKHSFRSMDCTSSVIRRLHEEKFSSGRTKCESIVVNTLAPFAMQQILEELESVKYLTVMVDTSNHKYLKLVPVLSTLLQRREFTLK